MNTNSAPRLVLLVKSKVKGHLAHGSDGKVWSVVHHERTNKAFRDENSMVPVHASVFEALGVKVRPVTANFVRLAAKHPEAFSSPAIARAHVNYTLEHPDIAIPATRDGYTLIIRKGDADRVVCVDLVERQGRYSVRSAYYLAKGQLEEKLKGIARRQDGTPAVLAIHGRPDRSPEIISRPLDGPRDPLQPSLKKSIDENAESVNLWVDWLFSDAVLAKSQGDFKHSGKYALINHRWRKLAHDERHHVEPVHVPEFQEGKTVSGVKDYYDAVAQKLLDASAAGDVAALEAIKAKGLQPNAKGKITNTWAGKTENSKMLLGLYDKIVGHIQGSAKHAAVQHMEQDQKQADIPAEEKAEDKAAVAAIKEKPAAEAVDAAAEHIAEDRKQDTMPATEKKQDAALAEKLEAAKPGPRLVIPVKKPAAPQPDLFSEPTETKPALHATLDRINWDAQKLPDENRNAKSHNRHVDKIRAMAYAGDVAGLDAFVAGSRTNTYGRKQTLLARTALEGIKDWAGASAQPQATEEPVSVEPKETSAPDAAPVVEVAEPADPSPQEGERNAEGLVFRDGRWHRYVDADESGELPPMLVPVSDAASTDGDDLSDDPNSPNYRFKDTGYIAGSRKEEAEASIRGAAKRGAQVRMTDVDWDELETNPRLARELIKKSNLFGKVDWATLRDGGMEPGAGFLIDRIYAAVPQEPDRDSPQKRKDFALGLESLRSRLETCKTPQQVVDTLNEIRDELEGTMLNEEQSKEYKSLRELSNKMYEEAREAHSVLDAYARDMNAASSQVNTAKWDQDKRTRRGWKPDPDLQKRIDAYSAEYDAAYKKWEAYKEDHPELVSKTRQLGGGWTSHDNDLEFAARQVRQQADAMMQEARAKNIVENPVTRAWITLGPKFLAVLNYRRSKGSDAFAGHVANARNGRIPDWSWAEKEGATVKKATKREVAFQLQVVDSFERKGGRDVTATSTDNFKKLFGLRDVQSGNWVLNDPTSAAWHVQQSSAAFADLADILGAQDNEVSLKGRLAMAFGARGHGNAGFGGAARAHYEPIQRVINLTKMGGGGALAHEWSHALDNICIEAETGQPAKADEHASENPGLLPVGELRDAFVEVRKAMLDGSVQAGKTLSYSAADIKVADHNLNRSSLTQVGQRIKSAGNAQAAVKAVEDYYAAGYGDMDKARPKIKKQFADWRRIALAYYDRNPEGAEVVVKAGPGMSSFAAEAAVLDGGGKRSYWSQTHEMFARAFQAYVEDKLSSMNRKNDYLSAKADNKYYRDPLFGDMKPFPEGEERIKINAAFDKLVAALQSSGTLAKAMML